MPVYLFSALCVFLIVNLLLYLVERQRDEGEDKETQTYRQTQTEKLKEKKRRGENSNKHLHIYRERETSVFGLPPMYAVIASLDKTRIWKLSVGLLHLPLHFSSSCSLYP